MIHLIDNNGPNTLKEYVKSRLSLASYVKIHIAFITTSGIRSILQPLRQTSAKVQVITGLYQGITEPEALKILLKLNRETRGRISVGISREPKLHCKVYVFASRRKSFLSIGSSNLTEEGLTSHGEVNVSLSGDEASKVFKDITRRFETDWKSSEKLSNQIISKYKKYRGSRPRLPHIPISKILGTKPKQKSVLEPQKVKLWRDCILGFLKNKTERIISETTNWDNYGWYYYSTGTNIFNEKDKLLLFDFTDKSISIVEVQRKTQTPIPTPDGRNFVAYKRVPGFSKKKFSPNIWHQLGISKKQAEERRLIGRAKRDNILSTLKKP